MALIFLIFIALAYGLGSVSSAILICKLKGLPDPRTTGSENPGATNVLRMADKQTALIVFAGDALKGFIPVLIGRILGLSGMELALVAVAAVIGHIFPVFFNFKGGKGIATAFGTWFALSIPIAVLLVIVWGAMLAILRYVSLASLSVAILAPLLILVIGPHSYFIPLVIMAALLAWRHMDNIGRLLKGTEPKIEIGKKK